MRIFVLSTALLTLLLNPLFAQQPLQLLLEQRGEVVVSMDAANILNIPNHYAWSFEPAVGDKVKVYLNKKQYQVLLDLNIPFVPEAIPSMAFEAVMAASVLEMKSWDAYPDYDTYLAMMQQFALDYPGLCKLDTIGETVEGRHLLALKISDNVQTDEQEPEVFYTSSMHGDELTGYVLMLRFADYLLTNYPVGTVKNLVDNLEIYINPLANPDGTFASGNSTVNGATRSNANYVDLNRNFPDPKHGEHPDGEEWQPETVGMMSFMDKHHFVMSMNFHGGAEVLNYPWDTFSARHADNNWFIWVCREYADTVHTVSTSYMSDLENGITNGYDWYEVAGGRQDYVTYYLHGREITNEISAVKLIDASQLPAHWDYNYRSLLNYLKQATYGIHGLVTDTAGNALEAKIFIAGHDKDSSHVRTDADGVFYRYLKAGDYTLTIEADSFVTQNVTVRVKDYQQSILQVEMQKPVGVTEFKIGNWNIYPNPVSEVMTIQWQLSASDLNQVVIYDQVGKLVLSLRVEQENYRKLFTLDVSGLSPGIYFVGVTNSIDVGFKKLIVQ